MYNNRRQVLIQDEINSSASVQWTMHTNATVSTDGSKATKDSALDSYGSLLEELGYSDSDNGGGSETDSSIDVNTPLP